MSTATTTEKPKRRTLPEGIEKRSKTYSVRIRLGGEVVGRPGFRTVAEAVAERDKLRADFHKTGAAPSAASVKVTVGDLAAEYLAAHPEWSYGTAEQKASEWRCLAPTFAKRRVTALTADDVEAWVLAQAEPVPPARPGLKGKPDGIAVGTVRNRLSLLANVLDRATRRYGIANVARLVTVPDRPRTMSHAARDGFAYTADEIAAVEEALTDRYRVMVPLLLGAGMRSGEARGLTAECIDWNTGAVRVWRQAVRVKKGDTPPGLEMVGETVALAPLKNHKSKPERVAYLSEDDRAAVLAHIDLYGLGPRDLIVTGRGGKALSFGTWVAAAKRASLASGVDLTGHDLRHTFASWSIGDDVTNVPKVAALLGHDVATCLRVYVKPERPDGTDLAENVAARMAKARAARNPRAKGHLRAVG